MKIYYFIIILFITLISCNKGLPCQNVVNVQLLRSYPNDSIQVLMGDSIYFKSKTNGIFDIGVDRRCILIDNICFNKDSFIVSLKYNVYDTSFYVQPKLVKSIVFGEFDRNIEVLFEYRDENYNYPNSLGFD